MWLEMKRGFTLAEVLVTLGIIGVVSAMTVPTLMQNYQRKSYVTQLHKVYNEIQQAAVMYMNDKNALNLREAGLINDNSIDYWMKNYFKIVQDCTTSPSSCYAIGDYKRITGTSIDIFNNTNRKKYVLASGAVLHFTVNGDGKILIYIDINGKQGPNIVGRDAFAVMLYNNGVIDDSNPECNIPEAPLSSDLREEMFEQHCIADSEYWWGCFGKILNDNWEMNY